MDELLELRGADIHVALSSGAGRNRITVGKLQELALPVGNEVVGIHDFSRRHYDTKAGMKRREGRFNLGRLKYLRCCLTRLQHDAV